MELDVYLTLFTSLVARTCTIRPCHCQLGTEWDAVSAKCKSGCEQGWTGSSCEKGSNIALFGTAFQSSTYSDGLQDDYGQSIYSAERAIDGQAPTNWNDSRCAKTYRSRNPWWYVIFDNSLKYTIESVTIHSFHQPSKNLPCNCLGNVTCLENGYCPNGCSSNWTGPACRVGLLPRWSTGQSSVYNHYGHSLTSDKAIDNHLGITNGEDDVIYCAHTQSRTTEPWWVVILDVEKVYVITGATIQNRYHENFWHRLSNFYITYSNSTDLDPTLWISKGTCYFHQHQVLNLTATFHCTHKAIGRSVGIEYARRAANEERILTLCEVYIHGYEYQECPQEYTGPGCVLYSCNSEICQSNGGSCDDYGACTFRTCPDSSFAPPQCWMRSLASNYSINLDILIDDSGLGLPNPTTWRTCNGSTSNDSTIQTFSCNNVSGHRLAIYMQGQEEQVLTLCEVTIIGFPSGDLRQLCAQPTGIAALNCHCAGDDQCTADNDFKCPGLCERGWTGDDCRSNFITKNAKSMQKSTLCDQTLATQQMCIYGSEKAIDNNVATCTTTRVSDSPWWLIQFDNSDAFEVRQIQIIRNSSASSTSQDLLILTTNSTYGVPNPLKWHTTSHKWADIESKALLFDTPTVARRLAVYLGMPNASLSICEVYIRGHRLPDKPDLSPSNVLVLRRSKSDAVHVAVNLSNRQTRLWQKHPTNLCLMRLLDGMPGGVARFNFHGPGWYTHSFRSASNSSILMTLWWEPYNCSECGKESCRMGLASATMLLSNDE